MFYGNVSAVKKLLLGTFLRSTIGRKIRVGGRHGYTYTHLGYEKLRFKPLQYLIHSRDLNLGPRLHLKL